MNFKDNGLNTALLFEDMNNDETMFSLVWKAAYIRAFLFAKLNKIKFSDKDDNYESKELKKALNFNDLECSYKSSFLQNRIDLFKRTNSVKIKSLGNCYVDYSIKYAVNKNKANVVFSGERNFIYKMFSNILNGNEDILKYVDLFYAYLLISSWFRGELVQNNKRTGFANFSDYQDRKEYFLEGYKAYEDALIAIALEANFEKDYIKSIEARFCPGNTLNNIKNKIVEFDKLANLMNSTKSTLGSYKIIDSYKYILERYENVDLDCISTNLIKNNKINLLFEDEQKDRNRRSFYVAHFPKLCDDKIVKNKCRHYNYREKVKNQAILIADMSKRQYKSAYRLLGIDACANEIGCRPEVFAQPFRFLKNHHVRERNVSVKPVCT